MQKKEKRKYVDKYIKEQELPDANFSEVLQNAQQTQQSVAARERFMQLVCGWRSADECAASVWNSIHSSLLSGELVFAYKRTDDKSDLQQLVIVKNTIKYDSYGNPISGSDDGYGVGLMTTGFSALYPVVSFGYLEDNIVCDLKKYKVNKEVLNNYLELIKNIKEKYGEE
jgi:hypothetical protein